MVQNKLKQATPSSIITERNLEGVFNSTFHLRFDFEDFLHFDITNEYECFEIHHKEVLKPSKKLHTYLRFINTSIFDYALINTNIVHSYRKGKNSYTAVEKHAKSKYFFQTDILDFFYSISVIDVENVINENLRNTPIPDIAKYKSRLLSFVTAENRLPVGFATSPNISNTCLYAFDNALESYCNDKNLIYTRYSDDIIISSKDEPLPINLSDVITEMLKKFFNDKAQLNPYKTKHTHKGKKIKLLGMVILPSGKVTVELSRPRGFHPQPLPKLYVNLSIHTAPIVQPAV